MWFVFSMMIPWISIGIGTTSVVSGEPTEKLSATPGKATDAP